ncbi:MAG TPA: translation initiation factor eIF-1A [Candidatus Nanoarchaeia archaeon]|nr:translation initiation factor eIF-1A [Candidatus Nanoarchaeia archaeon]
MAEAEEEFKDINEEAPTENTQLATSPIRVRLPRGEQMIGVIEQRHGGNKMMVACLDGKSRNCRVPGRLKRALWLRPGDVVMIEPWEFDKEKGDVIFKYTLTQISWLKKNGYLKTDKMEF